MKSALAVLAILSLSAAPAMATPQAPVIALSNAYYGNTWRHQMVEAFESAAKQAKSEGKIADYIVMNGDGSVAQQNSQIGELILKKVDVLLVEPVGMGVDRDRVQHAVDVPRVRRVREQRGETANCYRLRLRPVRLAHGARGFRGSFALRASRGYGSHVVRLLQGG